MPRTRLNLLTETALQKAKPAAKPRKLADGGGLYLLITPQGAKHWRFRYGSRGTETMLSLGEYPLVSLKVARERRDDARKQLAAGINPSEQRKAERAATGNTLQGVCDAWLKLRMLEVAAGQLAEPTVDRDRRQLRLWVLPDLGNRPVASVTTPMLLRVLKKIEAEGKHDTTYRTRETLERVFRYARRSGLVKENPADAELFEGVFASRATQNHAAVIDPRRVGELLRSIEGYDGQPATHAALRMLPYVMTRPGELRTAEWSEFDLTSATWRIPAAKMKMRDPHVVPLARQVLAILRDIKKLTGVGQYVFPAIGSGQRPLSNGTLNAALHRLGWSSSEATPHGFRSTASTLLNERGFAPDLIELQLAHRDGSVRAIYNRATRLDERRKMLQAYADHLDELRDADKLKG